MPFASSETIKKEEKVSDSRIKDLKLTVVATGSDLIVGYVSFSPDFYGALTHICWWVAKPDPSLVTWVVSFPDIPNDINSSLSGAKQKQVSDLVLDQLPKPTTTAVEN